MKGRTRTRIFVLVALCLPACDSCGCGERDAASRPKSVAQAGASGAAGGSTEQGGAGGTDRHKARRNQLTPMPDSPERRDLESAAKAIDVKSDLGSPVSGATLAQALPDEIDDYEAAGASNMGTVPVELGSATVVSRRYTQGKAVMHLKITDTADAPQIRADVVPQLTRVGNEPTGEQTGVLEDDIAGVRAYHKAANASRALALIGGRFLVEVLVDNTIKPDDAWTAITELDPDDLLDAAKSEKP